MKKIICMVVLFLGSVFSLWAGEFNFESYKPLSIDELKKAHPDDFNMKEKYKGKDCSCFNLGLDIMKYRFSVVFLGKERPVEKSSRKLLDEWLMTVKEGISFPKGFADLFKTEILVREGEKDYWLLIQEPLLPDLKKEVPAESRMDIFVLWIGAVNDEGIFLINEFKAGPGEGVPSSETPAKK